VKLNKFNKQLANHELIHIVARPDVLILAYETVKNNLENVIPSIENKIFDVTDLN
jgi:hypothetical protein